MKARSLQLTLYLVAVLFIATPLLAKDRDTQTDGPIVGSGSITKSGGKVRAFASASAERWATTGWFWIHARVLPYSDKYSAVDSDPIGGSRIYRSVYVRRTGQKSNGRAYCSMWAQSEEGYHSVLIDLP